jgi:hypothetical protein
MIYRKGVWTNGTLSPLTVVDPAVSIGQDQQLGHYFLSSGHHGRASFDSVQKIAFVNGLDTGWLGLKGNGLESPAGYILFSARQRKCYLLQKLA